MNLSLLLRAPTLKLALLFVVLVGCNVPVAMSPVGDSAKEQRQLP